MQSVMPMYTYCLSFPCMACSCAFSCIDLNAWSTRVGMYQTHRGCIKSHPPMCNRVGRDSIMRGMDPSVHDGSWRRGRRLSSECMCVFIMRTVMDASHWGCMMTHCVMYHVMADESVMHRRMHLRMRDA